MPEPVDLGEARRHLRFLPGDDDSQDPLILTFITVGREWVETYTGLDLTMDFGAVPASLKAAILILVTGLFENRAQISPDVERTARALCDPYRPLAV